MPTNILADLLPVTNLEIPSITKAERDGALDAIKPIVEIYAIGGSTAVRPDLRRASEVLLMAAAHAALPQHNALWASLPESLIDPQCVAALRPLGVACDVLASAIASEAAQAQGPKVPVVLWKAVSSLRDRMFKYLSYRFENDLRYSNEIRAIRSGQGYDDRTDDLRRMSVIAAAEAEALKHDPNYLPTDAEQAGKLAAEMRVALASKAGDSAVWVNKVWSATRRCYVDEVQPVAEVLYRHHPAHAAYYSSIYVNFGRSRGGGGDVTTP